MTHIGSAANAARSGLVIVATNGGESTSSSHSAQPATIRLAASATVSTGYLTSAFTTTGKRQRTATAMKAIRIDQARLELGRCDLAVASLCHHVPCHGVPSTMSAGTAEASTANCSACTNT